ncbi:MAG: HU family DNA-binding protein [Desulfovibrio sp.]|jgi:DNA-binding protein HU-beta|nr:HU family DNA-binding protein [Desulfovibrio sp.]
MIPTLTQAEFIRAVQVEMDLGEKSLSPSKIKAVLAAAGSVARGLLADGRDAVVIGLGVLKPVARAAREGRNPRTGEPVKIPARKAAKFRPGKALKDALKG